jgi:hypothetical protein
VIALVRFVSVASLAFLAGVGPASAWWRYAEWGKSEAQIVAASRGAAAPCRPDAPVCGRTANGATPVLFIPSVETIGLAASVAFAFDAKGQLNQTIVLFPNAEFELVCRILQSVHGNPIDDRPGASPVRVWRDDKQGSLITATSAAAGTLMSYQPTW